MADLLTNIWDVEFIFQAARSGLLNSTIMGERNSGTEGSDNITAVIRSKVADEKLHGDGGNDVITVRLGAEYFWDGWYTGSAEICGDEGDDTIYDQTGAGNLLIDGGVGNDTLHGSYAFGGSGNDILYGNRAKLDSSRRTRLGGGDGNDILKGGTSVDFLFGDLGDDFVSGGRGNDVLYGGAGRDASAFETKSHGTLNKDAIKDFRVVDDSIHLDNAVFTKAGAGGRLKSYAFWSSTSGKAHDANDRVIYDKDSGVLYYDADGSGAGAAIAFATISKNLAATYKDFFVI